MNRKENQNESKLVDQSWKNCFPVREEKKRSAKRSADFAEKNWVNKTAGTASAGGGTRGEQRVKVARALATPVFSRQTRSSQIACGRAATESPFLPSPNPFCHFFSHKTRLRTSAEGVGPVRRPTKQRNAESRPPNPDLLSTPRAC